MYLKGEYGLDLFVSDSTHAIDVEGSSPGLNHLLASGDSFSFSRLQTDLASFTPSIGHTVFDAGLNLTEPFNGSSSTSLFDTTNTMFVPDAISAPTVSLTTLEAGAQITRDNFSWASSLGTATGPISFGFATSASSYTVSGENVQGTFSPFTDAEKAAARAALQLWADVANITFADLGDSNNASIEFRNYASSTDNSEAFAYYPSPYATSSSSAAGDVFINTYYASTSNDSPGTYEFLTFIHEIGHTIGLQHPGDYNAAPNTVITYDNNAAYIQDTWQYSLMSYFSETNTGGSWSGYNMSPMIDDIAAAQRLYGANGSTRIGNTIYGFHSNAGSPYDLVSSSQTAVYAIWDAGGHDRLDFSGYSQDQTINLNAETFSDVGGSLHNVSIARGTIVEDGYGGSGNDQIFGNNTDNRLIGNAGDDSLYGGNGLDVLLGGTGNDKLYGSTGNDKLYGSTGNDNLYGSTGDDTLVGGLGNDSLNGGSDNDRLYGSTGDNELYGSTGNDTLVGGSGNNTLNGGDGNDKLFGSTGNDKLFGSTGNDNLYGKAGNDTLVGGSGNDNLNGGDGNDKLFGSTGNDSINGGTGNDLLTGDDDADMFIFDNGFGNDTVRDFSAIDSERINLSHVTDIVSFADLVNNHLMVDPGTGFAEIVDGANSILLQGIHTSQIGLGLAYSDHDFIF